MEWGQGSWGFHKHPRWFQCKGWKKLPHLSWKRKGGGHSCGDVRDSSRGYLASSHPDILHVAEDDQGKPFYKVSSRSQQIPRFWAPLSPDPHLSPHPHLRIKWKACVSPQPQTKAARKAREGLKTITSGRAGRKFRICWKLIGEMITNWELDLNFGK